jgi:aminoglycoside 2'-N-acetyltransferase I
MEISTEVRHRNAMTEADWQRLDSILDTVPDEMDEGRRETEFRWTPGDTIVLAFWDGPFVAHLNIQEREVMAGGQAVRVAGIGAVVTHPDYRGRGLASAAMRRAAALLQEEVRVDFGLLFCMRRTVPFYSRLGWVEVPGPIMTTQPAGKVRLPATPMILPVRRSDWPGGEIDLRGLPW